MRDLTVVGLSEDRRHVVLRGVVGEEFQVPADDRLRATLRNDRARLGQLEIEMDSALRPRDIQARIRRGDSPEAVAEAAQVPVDKIMGYAVPVLAEREHMADRARTATIRRKNTQTNAVSLGDAVDTSLRASGHDPDGASWDSWRREDGRWTVTVTGGAGVATYLFDSPGRYVVAEDETGRALVGDVTPGPDSTDMAIAAAVSARTSESEQDLGVASLKQARARRALAQEQLMLESTEDGQASETDAPTRADGETEGQHETTVDLTETAHQVRAAAVPETPVADGADEPRRPKRRERRRVPSWDEIMFGDRTARE